MKLPEQPEEEGKGTCPIAELAEVTSVGKEGKELTAIQIGDQNEARTSIL